MLRRSPRAGVEDRWHRPPRRGEQVPYPADHPGPGTWCMDPRHGESGKLVTTVRHGNGKRWLARWVDHEGQERTKSFDRKAPAKRQVNEVTAQLTTGTYADPRRGAVTFGSVAEPWFSSKGGLRPKTQAGYRSLLDVIVLPQWKDTPLRDMHFEDIQAWVNRLGADPTVRQRRASDEDRKGLSPSRVIQAFQVVDQVLGYAVRSHYIAANPADGIQLPSINARRKFALTHEQIRQLADAAGELGTMVYVLAYGGLRYGEVAALKVGDVNLERRRLKVERSVTAVAKLGPVEGATKTHQDRSVPLPQLVMDLVKEQVERRSPDELVFPHHDGGWIPRDWFALRLNKAATKAGVAGVTPHVLRHTAGSLAMASGASVVTVQNLLGHKSATMTMNVYTHQMPDDFDNYTEEMDIAARAAGS